MFWFCSYTWCKFPLENDQFLVKIHQNCEKGWYKSCSWWIWAVQQSRFVADDINVRTINSSCPKIVGLFQHYHHACYCLLERAYLSLWSTPFLSSRNIRTYYTSHTCSRFPHFSLWCSQINNVDGQRSIPSSHEKNRALDGYWVDKLPYQCNF